MRLPIYNKKYYAQEDILTLPTKLDTLWNTNKISSDLLERRVLWFLYGSWPRLFFINLILVKPHEVCIIIDFCDWIINKLYTKNLPQFSEERRNYEGWNLKGSGESNSYFNSLNEVTLMLSNNHGHSFFIVINNG